MDTKIKEPWITIIAIVSVIIAIFIFNRYFIKQVPEQIIQPDFTKTDIEKLKNEEAQKNQERNEIFKKYQDSINLIEIYKGGLVTPISLIQACEDTKRIAEKCNEEIAKITKIITTETGIDTAYLYVKAGVSREGASLGNLTENDSIYFFIDNGQQFGGHLLRSQAIWSRINTDGIELLFDLKYVPFTRLPYDDLAKPDKMPNLLEVLNQPGKHFAGAFVSTLGYGKIFELKIGYNGGKIELK